jgi:diguanylate cyclase (GGDEF)-like protein/PAS domain S-box-containing protein
LSVTVENVLYIGDNIQLVEAVLNLSQPASEQSENTLSHLLHSHELEAALAKNSYTHLICERPLSFELTDRINTNFPLLKTTFLSSAHSSNLPEPEPQPTSMHELLTDEVKIILDFLTIPVYFKNKKGEYLACNRCYADLFGVPSSQIIGKKVGDFFPENLRDDIEEIDQQIFNDPRVYFYECKLQHANGHVRDMVFRKESVGNGELQIGTMFDISETNKTKYLLEKEQILLRATADISTELVFFKDLEGRFTGCNKQFEKFIGCSEEEILGKKDEQLFDLEQALMCQSQDQQVMSSKLIYLSEEYLTYHNGQRHFIEMKKMPLLDKNGDVQGLIAVGRDITAHHLLQKHLKIANVVFENSKDSILVTDQNGNIISANSASCALFCFSQKELLCLNINAFNSDQHGADFYEQVNFSLQENKNWQGDITYCDKKGETHFAWLDIYIVDHPAEGVSNRIYSFTDLCHGKRAEEKIQFLSKHDPLTGLFNRIALFTRLEDAIARAKYKAVPTAVILVDINNFKAINDQYGHNIGDQVLKSVAQRLRSCVSEKNTVARFSDDEFIIIVDELTTEKDVAFVAQRVAERFKDKFVFGNTSANLSAKIGISIYPDDGMDIDTLLGNAEKAIRRGKAKPSNATDDNLSPANSNEMKHNKQSGNITDYYFYTRKLTHHYRQQVKFENQLKQALLLDQFELYYQPQYNLHKKQIIAMESLLYWNHPEQGAIMSDCFSILAEKSGLSIRLCLIMIRKAALQAVTWQQSAIQFGRITIKLSLVQLSQASFIADLQLILKETQCASQWLEFAMDEDVFKTNSTTVHDNMLNISKLGIALTLDNFAAEFPLLYLFEQLRIEKLKLAKHYIQGEFIADAVIKSVTVLAQGLGLELVGDTLQSVPHSSFPMTDDCANQAKYPVNPMKATEATFYLRCNKSKGNSKRA